MVDIVALVMRIAKENPTWGYTRIRGALSNLGHKVGRGTIANIFKEHGIEPVPERAMSYELAVGAATGACKTDSSFPEASVHSVDSGSRLLCKYVLEAHSSLGVFLWPER
jgi:hypothetical protein